MLLRDVQAADLPFLREMLYEAVFWLACADRPSFEEGLAYPEVNKILADWGARDGDTAVVAAIAATPIGAAWYRCWADDSSIRGYVDAVTPVVVIGVHRDYRHQGAGKHLLDGLIDRAARQSIQQISLCVSKDNYAITLYRQKGFVEYADTGDSFVMVRKV
ncbi:MAG: GNAT family N-acetyltransferase [Anaerolineae bacterium]|nr:GNAT family N-acetyltransferase [Anaerolineae bacterium]